MTVMDFLDLCRFGTAKEICHALRGVEPNVKDKIGMTTVKVAAMPMSNVNPEVLSFTKGWN